MTPEDEEFNRIERESKLRMEAVRGSMAQPVQQIREALIIAIDYMSERLENHDDKYQRHSATESERNNILADIETVKEALASQKPQNCGTGYCSCIECVMK